MLAGELAVAVAQLLLRARTLVLRHRRPVLLQLVLFGLEGLLLVLQVTLTRRELRADRFERDLGLRRFLDEPPVVYDTDLELDGPRGRYSQGAGDGHHPDN